MKSLNAKRIATVVAGAALLGIGLAFAGPVTFQNVPIISNSGQPVVQVVVGSSAKASDGVAAANIAAAIGNLAYTSIPVTASVNATQAMKVLGVSVTNAAYTLANPQVYMNVSGSSSVTGSYSFGALIGSVLNGAVILGSAQNTKTLQGSGSYAYPEANSLSTTPAASPYYTGSGSSPVFNMLPTAGSNGGGVSFTGFQQGSQYDNIMQITNQQLPALLSNYGTHGETETLWITGFPVYDQQSSYNNFELLSAGGAYEATFATPIQFNGTASNKNIMKKSAANINVPIKVLGQSWTIITGYGMASNPGSSNVINGGGLQLASSLSPLTTLSIGQNMTSGPFTVQLQDLGVNSSGFSPAELAIYYNGALNTTSAIQPPKTASFNISGHTLFVHVNQTFAGYYAYEKWAKVQLYSNVFNVTNGKAFNQTTNPGWTATLFWTNTSSTSGSANAVALKGIVLYNASPIQQMAPGSSFSFIQNPSVYKLTFLPDTFNNFDAVTAATSSITNLQYANAGYSATSGISNITEASQVLTVTSQIPNAFTYAGQTGSSVTYDLTPYQLKNGPGTTVNTLNVGAGPVAGSGVVPTTSGGTTDNVVLTFGGAGPSGGAGGAWVSSTQQLTVQLQGYTYPSNTLASDSVQFTSTTQNSPVGVATHVKFYNITSIALQTRALPGPMTINVVANTIGSNTANVVVLGTLTNAFVNNAGIYYPQSSPSYDAMVSAATYPVTYNPQNGQLQSTFNIASTFPAISAPITAAGLQQYFTYTMNEVSIPSNSVAFDSFAFGIVNASGGVGVSPEFQLNYSASTTNTVGNRLNMTYSSSIATTMLAQTGFRSERGSKVASITPSVVTVDLAKTQDYLQFAIGPANSTVETVGSRTIGPFGIGQPVTGFANLSVSKINATPVLSGKSTYAITGVGNITATPSVSMATEPVLLKNMTTPLVVLDAAANPASNLILVGSGYVNALSAQLQRAYNVSMMPTTQIMQAYGTNRVLIAGYYANQTTASANAFIAQLYAQAAHS